MAQIRKLQPCALLGIKQAKNWASRTRLVQGLNIRAGNCVLQIAVQTS